MLQNKQTKIPLPVYSRFFQCREQLTKIQLRLHLLDAPRRCKALPWKERCRLQVKKAWPFPQEKLWHQGSIHMQVCLSKKRLNWSSVIKWAEFWGALRPKCTGICYMSVLLGKPGAWGKRGGVIHFISPRTSLRLQGWKLKLYFSSRHTGKQRGQKSKCICSPEWKWFCWMEGISKVKRVTEIKLIWEWGRVRMWPWLWFDIRSLSPVPFSKVVSQFWFTWRFFYLGDFRPFSHKGLNPFANAFIYILPRRRFHHCWKLCYRP